MNTPDAPPAPICRGCYEDIPTENNPTLKCPKCGTINRPIAALAVTPPEPPAREPIRSSGTPGNAEPVYFVQANVTVTKSRFIVGTQTFAMANVTSVDALEIPPKRGIPLLCAILISVILAMASTVLAIGGMVFGFMMVFLLIKPTYAVQLTTSAGQREVCTSRDPKFIRGVVDAINRSIVERG